MIDTCLTKQQRYDPDRKMFFLTETLAPKSTMIQRAGRVGRLRGGACYKLISRAELRSRSEWNEPEIQNRPLEEVLLRLLQFKCVDIISHIMSPPQEHQVEAGLASLRKMGALKGEKGSLELTDIGYILGQLPVHPSVGLIAYFGFPFRMLEESIITASILATKSPIIAVAQRGDCAIAMAPTQMFWRGCGLIISGKSREGHFNCLAKRRCSGASASSSPCLP